MSSSAATAAGEAEAIAARANAAASVSRLPRVTRDVCTPRSVALRRLVVPARHTSGVKRLLALVAAAAMVVGALAVRGELGGDGGGIALGPGEPLRLLCVPELAAMCEALESEGAEITLREAGEAAAGLAADSDADYDGWLTLNPWPAMVEETRSRAGLEPLVGDGEVVGRSPLVMAVWDDRRAVLDRHCRGGLSWKCVGTNAATVWADLGGETGWGPVKVGFRDPVVSAGGLLVLGQATSDFFGTADFSTRDFEDPKFPTWLADLKNAVPNFGTAATTPLQQMPQRGRGVYDLVGTTEAEAGPSIARAAAGRAEGLELLYPEPLTVAEAVLAPLVPEAEGRLVELVNEHGRNALAESGWRVVEQPLAQGLDADLAMPSEANLPSPGALEALRGRWEEIKR